MYQNDRPHNLTALQSFLSTIVAVYIWNELSLARQSSTLFLCEFFTKEIEQYKLRNYLHSWNHKGHI